MVTKQYNTRGKTNILMTEPSSGNEEGIDCTPLCLSLPTPQLEMEDTPLPVSTPTHRTPRTPSAGLLGDLFSRRKSTPTNREPSAPAAATSNDIQLTPTKVDLLDILNTQELDHLLDVKTTPLQENTTTGGETSPGDTSYSTPLRYEKTSPVETSAPLGEAASPSKTSLVVKLPVQLPADTDDTSSRSPAETIPKRSPLKRKASDEKAKSRKKKKKRRKEKEKQKKLEELADNQLTISQQLIDFDLKLEALNCVFNKVSMIDCMENILEKVKELRAVCSQSSAQQQSLQKEKDLISVTPAELPPPPPEWDDEEDVAELKAIILAQQNQIDLLNGELDEKDKQVEKLSRAYDCRQQEKTSFFQMQNDLLALKVSCADKDSIISEYMSKSTEWDILAAKKSNDLQYAEEEIIELKHKLKNEEGKRIPLQHENLYLKQELHKYQHEQSRPTKTNYAGKADEKAQEQKFPLDEPAGHIDKDLVFIHDSIGKGITDGIMSKYQLTTSKVVSYTQEQAHRSINNITGNPKAIILHVGTNDIKNNIDADVIISNYECLVGQIKQNHPETKVILSSILPREDNHTFQRNVEYVNAAINRKFATVDDVVIIRNSDIYGKKLKRHDGIHLTDQGISRLASHIRDSVLTALKIKKK